MLRYNRASVFFIVITLLFSNFVIAQAINIPDVGEGQCVPVNPSTGEYDPASCNKSLDTTKITETIKETECEGPPARDCNAECEKKSEKCTYNGPRNCNAECQNLPSYPTYEKEACINKCVAEDTASRDAYYDCLNKKSANSNSQDDCLSTCLDEVKADQDAYDKCIAEEDKKKETNESETANLTIGDKISAIADTEYETIWDNGTRNETETVMQVFIDKYYDYGGCPGLSPTENAWSAAFVSYVMKQAGVPFPVNCTHTNYFTQIKDDPGFCKTYPITEKENIKVGDIICRCQGDGCSITYDNVKAGQSSHCDIITDRSDNIITYIGGNRWAPICGSNKSIGCTVAKSKKLLSALGANYFGFISCGEEEEAQPAETQKTSDNTLPPSNVKLPKNKPENTSCPLAFILIAFLFVSQLISRK